MLYDVSHVGLPFRLSSHNGAVLHVCDLRLPDVPCMHGMCSARWRLPTHAPALQDLALYWLVYTEAANLRHTPEMMWFIFFCAQRSWQVKQVRTRHRIGARCRRATDAGSHDG